MPTKEVAQLQMAVKEIVEGSNCRSRMNPGKFEELVQNVKKVGILEPALVRRDAEGKVILIAGHRRLAAAKAAGLENIPVRLLEVDEKQAAEIQTLENLHREDLASMDEARAFKQLLDGGSHTIESLAAQIDKSPTYVYRSLRLLELPAKAIKALEEGIITTGHAQQILRAPEKNAEALVAFATTRMEWQKRYPSVSELREYVEKRIAKDLAAAPFPKDVPYAEQVACNACPFNTGNQNVLFDGATKGHCTNPGCFNRKTAAYYKELQTTAAARYAGLKFLGTASDNGYASGPQQIKGAYVVEKLDDKIKKAIQAKPDQFGFGIVKPSRWGGKKARVVLLCKEAKLAGVKEVNRAPAYREQTPEEREREEFIRSHVQRTYAALAVEMLEFDKEDLLALLQEEWDDDWKRRRVLPFLEASGVSESDAEEGKFPAEVLEKKSRDSLIQLVLLSMLNDNSDSIGSLLEVKKVKVQEVLNKAQAEALKVWNEKHPQAA
jgi:ParB/RepB/Spo0J family partition protein